MLSGGWLSWITQGGMTMIPLILCSLIGWGVIFERLWRYKTLRADLRHFHLEAMNALLRRESDKVRSLCANHPELPTALLLSTALERREAKDARLREGWQHA